MTNKEAINWLISLRADIGKIQHQDLWHYEQALAELIDLLEAQQWIPCSKYLPKEYTEVIVSEGESVFTAKTASVWYEGYRNDFWTDVENGNYVQPDAWMPLPEPYKEDE